MAAAEQTFEDQQEENERVNVLGKNGTVTLDVGDTQEKTTGQVWCLGD